MNNNDITKIINDFNNTNVEYPKERTIVQLFEEQVNRFPQKIAAVFEDEQITYSELNKRANGLAMKLRELGVKPNDFVAIFCERSIEMIVAIYGVIKSGGAYVPIDPFFPKDRIQYILSDCKPNAILLYHTEIESEIPIIDLSNREKFNIEPEIIENVNNPDDLIYLLYTSGTTGKPKGVMIKHSSVVNYTYNNEKSIMKYAFDLRYSRIVSVTNLVFDICATEIILPLVNGMTTYIANEHQQEFVENFQELILKHEIEILQTTPSRMKLFLMDTKRLEYLKQLKFIMLGGERVDLSLVRQLRQYTKAVIQNVYGPTEATIWSTSSIIDKLDENENITIGKPISNTQIYILDDMSLCEIGQRGELCIAGDGLAKGYLNLTALTDEKFVDNPFGKGKLYRTGDMASWSADGNINFFGRIDDQIKVRGFRIELGEIESIIRGIAEVKDVVVISREDTLSNKEINAYIISDNSSIITKVREELKSQLPEYMIPAKMMRIEIIPLNASGKVDKKALPEITEIKERQYVAPSTPLEEEIVSLWEEMLTIESIGIDDNFLELGGHSLIANKMVYKINQMYDIDLSVMEFLIKGLTIRALSEIVEEKLFASISDEELATLLSEIDD